MRKRLRKKLIKNIIYKTPDDIILKLWELMGVYGDNFDEIDEALK